MALSPPQPDTSVTQALIPAQPTLRCTTTVRLRVVLRIHSFSSLIASITRRGVTNWTSVKLK
jgi:hypothetical protein